MGAIRLFLALVVAIGHLRSIVLGPAGLDVPGYYTLGMNAGYAVMFFYMISGFLMSMVLSEKYSPTAAGTTDFYRNRFIRIFSLYWPMVIVVLIVPDIRHMMLSNSLADKFTNFFLLGMDWRVSFASYPSDHWDAAIFGLRQAWTLSAELSFYLLAPFVVRSRKLTVIFLIASAATRACTVYLTGTDQQWTYYFLPSTFVFFLIGHVSYCASRTWPQMNAKAVAFLLLAGSVGFLLIPTYADWDSPRFWCAALCFAFALPGIFRATSKNKFLNTLGNLSFPVYMVHVFLIVSLSDLGFFKSVSWPATTVLLSFLGMTMMSAVVAYVLLERPTSALLHALFRGVTTMRIAAQRAEIG
jgi:peptidoglycan/LPS O-acetylase OafA/YrhL